MTKFQTKEAAKEQEEAVNDRIDRLEKTHIHQMARVGEKLDKVADDIAFIRGRMEGSRKGG